MSEVVELIDYNGRQPTNQIPQNLELRHAAPVWLLVAQRVGNWFSWRQLWGASIPPFRLREVEAPSSPHLNAFVCPVFCYCSYPLIVVV